MSDAVENKGTESRRYPRHDQVIGLVFASHPDKPKGRTVNVSKTGALVESPMSFPETSELVMELEWGDVSVSPVIIKATVVRNNARGPGKWHLGVNFSEALSRDVHLLMNFLQNVLHVNDPETKILNKNSPTARVFSFFFDKVQREGEERLAAVRTRVVSTLEELDELDNLLESFGTGAMLEKTSRDLLSGDEYTGYEIDETSTQGEVYVVDEQTNEDILVGAEMDAANAAARSQTRSGKESIQLAPAAPVVSRETQKKLQSVADGPAILGKMKKAVGGVINTNAEKKGGDLLNLDAREMVARTEGLAIDYVSGANRGQATVVKLHGGGMRCMVDDNPPEAYRGIIITLPLPPAGKKARSLTLQGEVTRVLKNADAMSDGAMFEVRLSMRNSVEVLNAYRTFIESINANASSET